MGEQIKKQHTMEYYSGLKTKNWLIPESQKYYVDWKKLVSKDIQSFEVYLNNFWKHKTIVIENDSAATRGYRVEGGCDSKGWAQGRFGSKWTILNLALGGGYTNLHMCYLS